MATLGRSLTAPEPGWKRYDDAHPLIMYIGSWVENTVSGSPSSGNSNEMYNSKEHMTKLNSAEANGSKFRFRFIGSKIRLLGSVWYENTTTQADLYIDGEFIQSISLRNTSTYGRQILYFEKLDLSDSEHTIEVINRTNWYLGLDAVDIDENGRLLHPQLREASNIFSMQVGDVIACEYIASSNTIGTFENLGRVTKDNIPVTPSNAPNGSFYFIFVGYDHLGRMKLIADRNIQTGITWNVLNNAGFVGGENTVTIDGQEFFMRILSGGNNSNNNSNEWDQIIVNYDLDGKITAGDNNIWHWSGVGSWTSSTPSSSGYRIIRGNGSVSARTENQAPTASSTTIGFRPVLLVPVGILLTLVSFTDRIYNQNVNAIVLVKPAEKDATLSIRYRYIVSGIPSAWSSFQSDTTLNISIPYNLLEYGNNYITIEVEDQNGNSSGIGFKVYRELTTLLQPDKVYFNNVDLDWLPILSPDKITSLYLKKTGHQKPDDLAVLYLKVDDGVIKDMLGNYPTITINSGVSVSSESNINLETIYFNGTADGTLILPTNSALNFGTGDFTIEFWLKWESRVTTYPHFFTSASLYFGISLGDNGGGKATFFIGSGTTRILTSTSDITDNKWHHLAVCRKNGVFYLFIDGKLESTNSSYLTTAIDFSTNTTIGGAYWTNDYRYKGWIDELIITKGKAVYTENFTPSIQTQLIPVTGSSYNDTDIDAGDLYMYSILAVKRDNSTIESNFISINAPPEIHLYYEWNGHEYVLKYIEGLAFRDTNGKFYTAPNGIKIRPLNVGNLVGGRQSNMFGFEIVNMFEDEDYNIELKVSRNGILAEDKGNYALLYDSSIEKHRTEVYLSLDGINFDSKYPLITHLAAGESKTVYMKIKPSTLTNGPEIIQVHLTGRKV